MSDNQRIRSMTAFTLTLTEELAMNTFIMTDSGIKESHTKPERRKNADRSATTRRQIFEATVRLLFKEGYSAVTNMRVSEEVGISTGAVMHHFKNRQELLIGTLEYAYGKVKDFRMRELSKVAPGLPRYRALIDLAWTTARMSESIANNEIRTGSRSDPVLRAAITPMMVELADDYGRFVGEVVREAGLRSTPEVRGLTAITVLTFRSLAINTFTYPREEMLQDAFSTLKTARESIIAKQLGRGVALSPAALEREIATPGRAKVRPTTPVSKGGKTPRRSTAGKASRK